MKNLTFASLCLAVAIFGILGCKKTLIEPTKHEEVAANEYNLKSDLETNISTDGRLLIFNSLESYENLWTPDEENSSQSEAAVAQFLWHGIRACSKYILGANAYAQINGNWVLMAFDVPSKNVNGTLYQVRINKGY